MTYRDEWGPWTEYRGSECPIPDGYHVQARSSNGDVYEGMIDRSLLGQGGVNIWDFHACYDFGAWEYRVVEYRIKTPRALQDLREVVQRAVT